jgi:hypothetical protein
MQYGDYCRRPCYHKPKSMTAKSVPAPLGLGLASFGRSKGSRRYEIRHNKTVCASIGQDVFKTLKTDVGWPRVIPSGNASIWETLVAGQERFWGALHSSNAAFTSLGPGPPP